MNQESDRRTEVRYHYKVVYYVLDQQYETLPYETYEIANQQREDIAGYEGVSGAHLQPVRVETRGQP